MMQYKLFAKFACSETCVENTDNLSVEAAVRCHY